MATRENMEGQYNPHFTAKKTEVPQGHFFTQANKLWHLQFSWILSEVVMFFPQVETQQQDGGSGWRALEFTAPVPSHGLVWSSKDCEEESVSFIGKKGSIRSTYGNEKHKAGNKTTISKNIKHGGENLKSLTIHQHKALSSTHARKVSLCSNDAQGANPETKNNNNNKKGFLMFSLRTAEKYTLYIFFSFKWLK